MGPHYVDFTFAFDSTLIRLDMTKIQPKYVVQAFLSPPPWKGLSTQGPLTVMLSLVPIINRCVQQTLYQVGVVGWVKNSSTSLFHQINLGREQQPKNLICCTGCPKKMGFLILASWTQLSMHTQVCEVKHQFRGLKLNKHKQKQPHEPFRSQEAMADRVKRDKFCNISFLGLGQNECSHECIHQKMTFTTSYAYQLLYRL